MQSKRQTQTVKFARARAARLFGVIVVQFETPRNERTKRAGAWVR